MAEPARSSYLDDIVIDVSHLVTEDDTPVENPFQDKQMRMLTETLYTSWQPEFPFVAMSDVGLFYSLNEDPLVPDVLVSTKVSLPADLMDKSHRSYFSWQYGKVPDVVIEIVSNKVGGELDRKLQGYHDRNIPYYVIFDPNQELSERKLRSFEYSPAGYVEMVKPFLPTLGLGLTLWSGEYETHLATWVRWCDANLQLLPFGKEGIEQERTRAEQAENENARLRELLRQAGLEPPS